MQRKRRLAVLVGGEVLRHGGGNGLVARHDALHQPTHGLHTQRQRNHIEQQHLAQRVVARKLIGLQRSTDGNYLVGVDIDQRIAPEIRRYRLVHLRHAGGAAHQHHTLNICLGQPGVTQRGPHGLQGAGGKRGSGCFKLRPVHRQVDAAGIQLQLKRRDLVV